MKTLIHHIQEKLKVSKNSIPEHTCKVVFGEFIAWLYNWPYYNILDLDIDDIKPELIFSSIRKDYFDNSIEKLYDFFCKYAMEIIEIESIEKYQGSWVYTFTLDNIYFETETRYGEPLDVRKKKNPNNNQLRFIKEARVDEKLKVSKNTRSIEQEELFNTVSEKLYDYNGLLDITTLKIPYKDIYYTCYMVSYKNRKDGITFVNKNGSTVSVYSFKELCDKLFYKEDIFGEEILNKILELIEENE